MTANRLSPGQHRARLTPRQKVPKTRASRRFSSPRITGDNCIRGQVVGDMWARPHLTQVPPDVGTDITRPAKASAIQRMFHGLLPQPDRSGRWPLPTVAGLPRCWRLATRYSYVL